MAKVMGKGDFRPLTAAKPLNRF